eukprot:TRINITY_DN22316_c0_g1_i1.p1 TRINITY_DN22316_c0_g1~~TRINITY_DN22316_c0_g1_i1.p1  ORF type:complete len:201 (+),score=46.93 TRINITY_DN22316_c0_g1_i1:120-722(+)
MPIKQEYLVYIAIAAGFTILSSFLPFVLFRNVEDKSERGLLLLATSGLSLPFGIPLIQSVWGTEGVLLAFLFDIPNVLYIFGGQVLVAEQYSPLLTEEEVHDPPAAEVAAPTEKQDNTTFVEANVLNSPEEELAETGEQPSIADESSCVRLLRSLAPLFKNAPFMSVLLALTLNVSTIGVPDYAIVVLSLIHISEPTRPY